MDSDYAQDLGVDTGRMILSQPEHMEQALSIVETSVKMISDSRKATGKTTPALIVLDSLNALPTKRELEGAFEDKHIGEQARMMGQGLKKLVRMLSAESVALVLISQLRVKIGVMFGDDLSTACGKDKWMGLKQLSEKCEPGSDLEKRLLEHLRAPYGWS